ncbi:radical SAM protein [Candidatus Amarolinea dominans]|uniref:B12-binding domain-containing radical SAM protein n=1 Tax=Candidatus Amarolinea dominans TaxID=3140696 RepID=UPI001DC13910|nr:B12-binding domain-containing radical SAM protein [Anaerolineae bacterium]
MLDVLLAHSYFLRYDQKQVEKMRPYPPLATLYAASYLRSVGYSVALFDAMLATGEHEFEAALATYAPRFVVLYEDNFNFLSKMCLTRMREAACTMSQAAHRRGATVIASGSDVTDHPEIYLQHGTQYVILGEPEHTLRELLDALRAGQPARASLIPGLVLPDPQAPGGLHHTARRNPERYPDVFPFPAWDLLDVERYRAAWMQAHGFFSLNMVSTRGCPFHCNWCAKPIWGQRYAMRSPANVAAEMAWIKQHLRPDHIWFADDIFGLRPAWVAELGREVAQRDAAIPFMIQSRVDLMTEDAVAGLKQAGCVEVWMGAESGSQKILDAMDKGTQVSQIKLARQRLKHAGIKACFFIQFGYPGETFEDIMSTVQLVRETLPDNIGISVSYPLPGTKFHDLVKEQLGPKTNWVDSNDLAMMFQGSYQSPFYRKLHRVLHRDLELRQRLSQLSTNGHGPVDDVALLASLDHLSHEWLDLGRLEVLHRSEAPTTIVKPYGELAAPDLSRDWN